MTRNAPSPDGPAASSERVSAVAVGKDGARETVTVSIVREIPFTVYLNDVEIVTLLCTGEHLDALAVGFLCSEGLIRDRAAFGGVAVDPGRGHARVRTSEPTAALEKLLGKRTVTSGCGKGTTFYNALDALRSRPVEQPLRVAQSAVARLMTRLHEGSDLYRETHGVHNCALSDGHGLLLQRADIGRHNALDMIIGECFLQSIPTGDKMLLTTGRITSEILIKAAKVGIPLVVSRSSPTAMAVELARELNVTVVGRARAGSMFIYHGAENIAQE